MTTALTISKKQAVDLLTELGFKTAKAFNLDRLQKKIDGLQDFVDDNTEVEEELVGLMNSVLEALEDEREVKVLDDAPEKPAKAKPAKKEEAKKPAAKKPAEKKPEAKPEAKPAKKPAVQAESNGHARVRPTLGRPYYAGLVLRKEGLDKGITDGMVKEVDELTGKPNPKESLSWLKLAWHVVNGYTKEV